MWAGAVLLSPVFFVAVIRWETVRIASRIMQTDYDWGEIIAGKNGKSSEADIFKKTNVETRL